jgi:hypothetical protein
MKRDRILLAFLFVLALSPRLFAQDYSAANSVFAPFVTRLEAETKNNLVRLSWNDSADARGPVYVYRSSRPFTEGASLGVPIEVSYNTQYYIDEPDLSGYLYYFVAVSDSTGQRYDLILPNINTASVVLNVPERSSAAQAAVQIPQRSQTDTISGIEARMEGESVIISFRLEGSGNTILYRGVRPFSQMEDLLNAVIVQSGISSPFIDYPVQGIPYYYAVIFENELARGSVTLRSGFNTTSDPVKVGTNAPGVTDMRAMPLPLFAAPGAQETVPLQPDTRRAIADLHPERDLQRPLKKPRAFNQDLDAPAGGEESGLRSIVQTSFAQWNWAESRQEILRYLALPRSGAPEARAHFYLGQAYYFLGDYREALLQFLEVQYVYPVEANEWIQDTLFRIVH